MKLAEYLEKSLHGSQGNAAGIAVGEAETAEAGVTLLLKQTPASVIISKCKTSRKEPSSSLKTCFSYQKKTRQGEKGGPAGYLV